MICDSLRYYVAIGWTASIESPSHPIKRFRCHSKTNVPKGG